MIQVIKLVGTNGKDVWINGKKLHPKKSQKVYNHSPDGFAWGYGGSGPAQLALAILLEVTGSKEIALAHYQDFKRDVISQIVNKTKFKMEVEIPVYN